MRYASFNFLALLLLPSAASTQPRKPGTIAELATYRGADRERLLYAGAKPPHPHAALLMADFLLSPDAQQVLEKFYYGSGAKDYVFKKWRPERGLTTDQYEKEMLRWKNF
jgi:hypothetical protein